MNWLKKLNVILIEYSAFVFLLTALIVFGILPIPAVYYVSPDKAIDEVINATISPYSDIRLIFLSNKLLK